MRHPLTRPLTLPRPLTLTRSLTLALALLAPPLLAPPLARAQDTSSVNADIVQLRLTLEREPENAAARVRLAELLIRIKRFEVGIGTLTPLTSGEGGPELPRALFLSAFALRNLQRYAEALATYDRFIELSTDEGERSEARFGRAKTLELMGDTAGAVEAFERFAAAEPRPTHKRWVDSALASARRLKASVAAIERTSEDSTLTARAPAPPAAPPAAPTAAPTAAPAIASSPQPKPTQPTQPKQPTQPTQPTQALKPAPQAPSAAQVVSEVNLATADKMFAAKSYEAAAFAYRALSQGDQLPEAQRALLLHRSGVSAFLAGKHQDARQDAELALALSPPEDLRRALLGLAALSASQVKPTEPADPSDARLALREGRFEDAVSLSREAARAHPTRAAELARVEGKALMSLGRSKEAFEALSRAAQMGGEHPQLTLELARAAEVSGRPAEALKGYRSLARDLTPAEGAPRPPALDEIDAAIARLSAQRPAPAPAPVKRGAR